MTQRQGIFYVIATPIGNLGDITLRAIETLKKVDWILAEDTRHSGALLQHYGIATPTKSLHDHNEKERLTWIKEALAQGQSLALISDAGTPLISDPGYHVVRALQEDGFKVVPIPGACAAVAALSVSGLATDKFCFEGFLPPKQQARIKFFQALKKEPRTAIFYEAPHRLLNCLEDGATVFGDSRMVVVARELTKNYETIYQDTFSNLLQHFNQHVDELRGEIVILIEGAPEQDTSYQEIERVLTVLLAELPVKTAAQMAAEITGGRKNEIYQMALKLQS